MRVLGMMSGTSMDAIDVALLDLRPDAADPEVLIGDLVHHGEVPWPAELRARLLAVLPPHTSDVGTWCRLHAEVGEALGRAAADVLAAHGGADLVASHGQTLFHAPPEGSEEGCAGVSGRAVALGASLQIGDAARIHAATGVPVIADLRAADLALGGHGAPLVPILDELLLGDAPSIVLNIGGIANVSRVGCGAVIAGDTGPGNALLDAAVHERSGGALACDADGALAATGTCDPRLLAALLADPFFARPLPRSTGREHFDGAYVQRVATAAGIALPPRLEDLLATLVELSARTIAAAIRDLAEDRDRAEDQDPAGDARIRRVVGSGGGMANPMLRERIAELIAPLPLQDVQAAAGLPGDAKEAVLVALLGWLSAHGLPGVLPADPHRPEGPATTGAARVGVLGTLTPPSADPAARERQAESRGHPVPPRRLLLRPTLCSDAAERHPS